MSTASVKNSSTPVMGEIPHKRRAKTGEGLARFKIRNLSGQFKVK